VLDNFYDILNGSSYELVLADAIAGCEDDVKEMVIGVIGDIQFNEMKKENEKLLNSFLLTYEDKDIIEKFKHNGDMCDNKLMLNLVAESEYNKLFELLDNKNKVRLISCGAYGATSWLTTLPPHYNSLNNYQFVIVMKMWLGINLIDPNEIIICNDCPKRIDPQCWHAILCGRRGYIGRRHNQVRNIINKQMNRGNYVTQMEKIYLTEDQEKPADIYVELYKGLKPAALDIGVTCPVQERYYKRLGYKQMQAADDYVQLKNDKYKAFAAQQRILYYPVIFEALGGISEGAKGILSDIAFNSRMKERKEYSIIFSNMKRNICNKIWSCNIDAIINKVPNFT